MADLSILRRVTAQTALRPATQMTPRVNVGLVLRQFGERYSRYEAMSRNWLQSRFDMLSRPGSIARYSQNPNANYSSLNMTIRNLRRRSQPNQPGTVDRSFDGLPELPSYPNIPDYQSEAAFQADTDNADWGYADDYAEPAADSYFAPEAASQPARLGDFQPLTMRNLFAVEAGTSGTRMTQLQPSSQAATVNRSVDGASASNSYADFAPTVSNRLVEPMSGVSYQAETALARVFERLNDTGSDTGSVSSAMLAARPAQRESYTAGVTPATEPAVRRIGQQWVVDLPQQAEASTAATAPVTSAPSVPMAQLQRQFTQAPAQASVAQERIQTSNWVGELGSLRHTPVASAEARQLETSVARHASFEPVVLRSLSNFAEPVNSTSASVAENNSIAPLGTAQVATTQAVSGANSNPNSVFLSVPPMIAQPSPLMRALERATVNSGADTSVTASAATETHTFAPTYLQSANASQVAPVASSTNQTVQRELEIESTAQPSEAAIAPRSLENNESTFATAAEAAPAGYGLQAQLQRFSDERLSRAQVTTELASLQHNPGATHIARLAEVTPVATSSANPQLATQVANQEQLATASATTPNRIARLANQEQLASASATTPNRIARLANQEQAASTLEAGQVSAATALNMTQARLASFSQPGLRAADVDGSEATAASAPEISRSTQSESATGVSQIAAETASLPLVSAAESQISRFATERLGELDAAFDLPTLRYNPGAALSPSTAQPTANVVSRLTTATSAPEVASEGAEAVTAINPVQAASDLRMTQARLANFVQSPRSQPVGEASPMVNRTSDSPSLQVFGFEYNADQQLRPTAGNALNDMAVQRVAALDSLSPTRSIDYERIAQSGEVTPADVTEVERRYIMPPLAMARVREATAPDLSRTADYGSMLRDEFDAPAQAAPTLARQVYPTSTDFPHLNQLSRFVNDRTELSVPERSGLDLATNRRMSLLDAEGASEKKDSGSAGFGYEPAYAVNLNGVATTADVATPSRTSVLMSQAASIARLSQDNFEGAAAAPRFTFSNPTQTGFAVQGTAATSSTGATTTNSASAAASSTSVARTFANPTTQNRSNNGASMPANDGAWSDTGRFADAGFFEAADRVAEDTAPEMEMFHPTAWIQRKVADVAAPKAKTASLMPKIDTIMRTSIGQQIESSALTRMNRIFNRDFEPVRVHHSPEVGEMVSSMGAEAFTAGSNIYFAPGRYQPDSTSGQALLGHELTHVVQQASLPSLGGGRVPEVSSQGQSFEHEAIHNENLILRHLESTHSSPAPQPASSRLTTSVTPASHAEPDLMSQFMDGTLMRSFEPVHLHSHDNQSAAETAGNASSGQSVQRSVDSSDNQVQRLVATPESYEPGKPTDNLTRQHLEMITDEVFRRVRHELMVERERHGINSRRFF